MHPGFSCSPPTSLSLSHPRPSWCPHPAAIAASSGEEWGPGGGWGRGGGWRPWGGWGPGEGWRPGGGWGVGEGWRAGEGWGPADTQKRQHLPLRQHPSLPLLFSIPSFLPLRSGQQICLLARFFLVLRWGWGDMRNVRQCEERIHDESQVAAAEQPRAGFRLLLQSPGDGSNSGCLWVHWRGCRSNDSTHDFLQSCWLLGGKERFCGRGGIGPGQELGAVSIWTCLGQTLSWLMAGKCGARLVGYPGRHRHGFRPETWVARYSGPISLEWKRAFSSHWQQPNFLAMLCVHLVSASLVQMVSQVGLICQDIATPKLSRASPEILPVPLISIFSMNFSPFPYFSLENGLPYLVSWVC